MNVFAPGLGFDSVKVIFCRGSVSVVVRLCSGVWAAVDWMDEKQSRFWLRFGPHQCWLQPRCTRINCWDNKTQICCWIIDAALCVCVCVWTSEKERQRETVSERMSMCWPDPCCRFLSCGHPSAGRRLVGRIVRNVHSGKTQQEDLLQTGTVPWEVDQHFIWQADFTGPAGQVRYCRKVGDFLWCRWSYVMSMVKSQGYYHVRALTH